MYDIEKNKNAKYIHKITANIRLIYCSGEL